MPIEKPQYGLPFQQLPGGMTPESVIDRQTQTGRKQIQDRFNLAWNEINRSARFVGQQKARNMAQQLRARAKQEMLQFDQQAQAQLMQLRDIDRLTKLGQVSNADELKARIVYGRDVAASMYPRPEKEPSAPEQFGKMDVLSQRISDELSLFKVTKKEPPKFPAYGAFGLVGLGIATTRYARARAEAKRAKPGLQILDYSLPSGEIDKYGDPEMGKYRKVTEEERQFYDFYRGVEKDIKAEKRRIAGQLDISRRVVQPGTVGGTFSDKVTESYKKRPTAAELRKRRTREAYEEGRKLRYWN